MIFQPAMVGTLARATRLPTIYVAHGGGPMPVLGDPGHAGLAASLKRLPKDIGVPNPTAILVVSAHWEEPIPTVTKSQNPSLIYDYYGFPKDSYSLKYPAAGSPALAQRVANLLRNAGIPCKEDPKRGFDHGVFIPLMLSYPSPDFPVVQLSLASSLDPELHIKMGEALASLRDEGVLLYGSGLSFHNMGAFRGALSGASSGDRTDPQSREFDNFLNDIVTNPELTYDEKRQRLIHWSKGPHARYAHPREEHLLPLMVAFGASGGENGRAQFSGPLLGAQVSSFQFGDSIKE